MFKKILRSIFKSKQKIDKLPIGMAEFETWANDVIEEAAMPNNDSTRFALATMLMHLGPTEDEKPRAFFLKSLKKGAVNQIAHAVMIDLKTKQQIAEQKRLEEEEAAKEAQEVSSDDATPSSPTQ